jgi:O-succinylbenzoate synthase
MKLARIEIRHVQMHLKDAFETSFGGKTELNHLIIKAWDENGLFGLGECAASSRPDYCPENYQTCLLMLQNFIIPATLGKEFETPEQFTTLYSWIRGNYFAKAGLEMAVWDLLAQHAGMPLSKFLGGSKSHIESGVSLGIEKDMSALLEKIERYVSEGYKRVKLKVKPGHDLIVFETVRNRYPDLPLTADANSAYTLQDIPYLKEFDKFNLMMVEQPLAHDDIIDHARLQREISTPVCLDESIHTAEDARRAIELGSCRIINIKAGRVGGLLEARKIHDVCRAHNIPVWCGGMHEYGVGRAHNVALNSLSNFSLPGDVSGSDKYFLEDIVQPPILAQDGRIPVQLEKPGLGYDLDETILKKYTVAEYVFK